MRPGRRPGLRRLAAVIVLIDLDNTLVDRRAAFDTWVSAFVAEIGGTDAAITWLLGLIDEQLRPQARS